MQSSLVSLILSGTVPADAVREIVTEVVHEAKTNFSSLEYAEGVCTTCLHPVPGIHAAICIEVDPLLPARLWFAKEVHA